LTKRLDTPEDDWTRTKRRRIAVKQGWKCYWCGFPMTLAHNDDWQVSLDEIVPRHMGGVAKPGNVVAAHRKCNEARHPEMNKRKASDPSLVATSGETSSGSPFDILKKRKHD